jgi:hypothetical protein
MSDQLSTCGGGPLTEEEIINSLFVKHSSGQYGLRAQVSNVASSAISDGITCNTPPKSLVDIFNMILTNSTVDGRPCIQFYNVTSV